MYDTTKPYKKIISELIKKTWETPYVSVKEGVVYKKFSFPEYHHSDGIGTKGVYHWQERSFENAVIDAMAMNLNDLALMRAKPYAVIDHLLLPEDDKEAIVDLISSLSSECLKRNIAITGGETAIHNNMEGLEISMTMLGFIENPKPNKFKKGDYLIGIESSGLHSNGFTKVGEIFKGEFREDFIRPTYIYLDEILELNKNYDIHGMMHITGGAYTKLIDLLDGNDALITNEHVLEPQKIFLELYNKGVSDFEMYKTFNCGVGFILGVSKIDADDVIVGIKNVRAEQIGEIFRGNNKVKIESKFSDKSVVYEAEKKH
jgi:phosphoribosylformylglycinamidine cyclo-ligase